MVKSDEILQGLRELPFNANEDVIVKLARMYGATQGWDTDGLMKRRSDYKFWDPEYLDPSGKMPGMGTMDAFRCLVDFHRTKKLVHGILETVAQKKKEIQEPLIAIDAGTGTGVLAMALIAAGCDYVHALEINPQTATATKQIVNQLGLENHISVVEGDATKIHLTGPKAQIIVSENLSNGLFDEPQYDIIHHLSQYATSDATIIPGLAELQVALGWSQWIGVDKSHITIRKLPDLIKLSNPSKFAKVKSQVGMEVPQVVGEANLECYELGLVANALIVSTRFAIYDGVSPIYLEPDSAQFLGKSTAFKIKGGLLPEENVRFYADYPAGLRKQFMQASAEADFIKLIPVSDYESRTTAE